VNDLTHLNDQGEAHMVDVGGKQATHRVAIAEGRIHMASATLEMLQRGDLKKGDALGTARIAGIMAAKRTAELIPLCHPLPLTHLDVTLTPEPENASVFCEVQAETHGQTGVEMEALAAVQTALLTVYDMCKALDRGMQINGVTLTHKRGGRTADWSR